MNAAVELTLLEECAEFFAPAPFDLIDSLVSEYNAHRAKIERLAGLMERPDAKRYTRYFVEGNLPDDRYTLPRKIDDLFTAKGAVAKLNAEYWSKAFNLTDVYDYMPQKRRDKWSKQIRNPLGIVARKVRNGDPDVMEVEPLPDFESDTVRGTLISLLNSRGRFFAERVDGIFQSLSRSHVTNRPEGFGKRMIVPGVVGSFGSIEWSMAGVISDLRCIIAKFLGREEPPHHSTTPILELVRTENGQWFDMDGGALRIRIYNGVGTAHMEVHPEVAWRLNGVLASLYPAAIPSQFRERPKRKSKVCVELSDHMLSSAVLNELAGLEPALIRTGNVHHMYDRDRMTLCTARIADKHIAAQVGDVLTAIGGVQEGSHWRFSFRPGPVVAEVLCTGSVPDQKTHQFYTTPTELAAQAVALAMEGAEATDTWLEPSAGTGGLVDELSRNVPKEQVTLVEVSELHCKVLESKGYPNLTQGDFLEYAVECPETFDRILMNPPFSQGRWQAHVEAAARLLKPNGRIIAILPASAKGKTLIESCSHVYSDVLANQFAGTSVNVVIVTIEKP